jgi:predicted nucleotidyltransferase
MDLSAPYATLLSDVEGSVLSVLAGTVKPLSGREVSRLAGVSQSTVRRLLARLGEHGLVRVQEAGAGAALLYSLNRDHLAADAVTILVSLRRRLIDRLRIEFEAWQVSPLHASLFGSAARGNGGTDSDIDLLIVRPGAVDSEDESWRRQLDRLPELVGKWTGNRAGIAEVSESDVERLKHERPSIVDELQRDAIRLHGPHILEILNEPL